MTDPPTRLPGGSGSAARPRSDTLGLRLALAFLAVALAAIALLAGLAAALASEDVSSLASRQRAELANAIAVAAGTAWSSNDSWSSADLSPVFELARRTGVTLRITDASGRAVASSPGFDAEHGPQAAAAVVATGQHLGMVQVRFTDSGLGGADNALRASLLRAIAGAAGLAALLALLTGLLVARRITRPIGRLITVSRSMAAGDRASRAGEVRGLGELRDLAASFDQMADSLDREDQIRRDQVATVAHELRTPIAVLQAGHEAMLDGIAEPTPEELSALRDEVLRLARMVGDLQTLAAADAAVLHLARRTCDLADIAADAADSLSRRFEGADIELDRELAAAPVLGDPRWLYQLVTNLLTNALKFTPGGGRVTVRTESSTSEAVLEVSDTGVGIAAEDLPRIFDRFWRGPSAARTSGTGIGLAIAADMAHAHGGALTATSTVGRGTTIRLTLRPA